LWFGPARSPVKSLGRKISSRPLPDIFISRCHQTYLSHADSIIFLGTARAVLRAPAPTTLLPPCSARHLLLPLVPSDLPWPAARPCSTPSLAGRVPLSSSSLLATRTGWRSRAGRRRSCGRRCRRTRRTSSCGSSSTPRWRTTAHCSRPRRGQPGSTLLRAVRRVPEPGRLRACFSWRAGPCRPAGVSGSPSTAWSTGPGWHGHETRRAVPCLGRAKKPGLVPGCRATGCMLIYTSGQFELW
jgi:hypothetical protein